MGLSLKEFSKDKAGVSLESFKKITFRLLKDNIIIPTSENYKAFIERLKVNKVKNLKNNRTHLASFFVTLQNWVSHDNRFITSKLWKQNYFERGIVYSAK